MSINLAELEQKRQQLLRGVMLRGAKPVLAELGAEVMAFAKPLGGLVDLPREIKKEDTAASKVAKEYGGDWLQIKDLARCTIVMETETECEYVFKKAKEYFVTANRWKKIEEKQPNRARGGYYDWKLVVSRGEHNAEIQINTKNMIYAKDMGGFKRVCPELLPMYKAKYFVPGGLGHAIYEIPRSQPHRAAEAAEAGLLYYAYFREAHPSIMQGMDLFRMIVSMNLPWGEMAIA